MELFDAEEKELLKAIDMHGGIFQEMTNKHGWTRNGLPVGPLRRLIDRRIVAPRIATSHPMRVVFQRRATGAHSATLAKIASEADRLKLKEYAPGGFELKLRPELVGRKL